MANYRNRKLLDLAHSVNECQFNISPNCIGYSVDGCEPAHSNHLVHGKGTGIKAHDDQHVASCRYCHLYYDSNRGGRSSLMFFNAGRARTFKLYEKNGWLTKVGYTGGSVK